MSANDDRPVFDADAGPLVRPYVPSSGRTAPSVELNLMTMICSTGRCRITEVDFYHGSVLALCWEPTAVAEVAAHMQLPVVVVKVLVGDLLDIRAVQAFAPQQPDASDVPVLKALLEGLQRL